MIAQLLRLRWHVELDLRNLKISLQLDDLRGKTPEMVRREIWGHFLAFNLLRKVMAQAALACERLPRELSFAAALSAMVTAWDHASTADPSQLAILAILQRKVIAGTCVGNRVEPRAIKRRPKPHKLLTKPRKQAQAELLRGKSTEQARKKRRKRSQRKPARTT